jgi:preprotein translocase subunit SecG
MIDILLIVHVVVSLLLLVSILLQKTSADSIANLAGSSNGFVSAQGAANFLTRATIVLAALFMINCLVLGNLFHKKTAKMRPTEQAAQQQEEVPMAQ